MCGPMSPIDKDMPNIKIPFIDGDDGGVVTKPPTAPGPTRTVRRFTGKAGNASLRINRGTNK